MHACRGCAGECSGAWARIHPQRAHARTHTQTHRGAGWADKCSSGGGIAVCFSAKNPCQSSRPARPFNPANARGSALKSCRADQCPPGTRLSQRLDRALSHTSFVAQMLSLLSGKATVIQWGNLLSLNMVNSFLRPLVTSRCLLHADLCETCLEPQTSGSLCQQL